MTVITRFAPSPTGFLHIGGARTALFNWLYARNKGGKFLLRIEDTDRERSTNEAIEAIINGMKWMGLEWDDEIIFQFARSNRHAEIAKQMVENGKAYYCYTTPEELAELRSKAEADGKKFRYDGSKWRNLDNPNQIPAGVKPVIRLKAPTEGETVIRDKVQGDITVANSQLDDMVLLRSDGTPTYMLAVVVDDHDMGITHIIRGDDHLTNAARQIQVYESMGWSVPEFAHIPLIHGSDGAKLSKRHGAIGIEAYRDMGLLPEAMRNYLLRLGWSHGDDEIIPTKKAIEWFNLESIGKSPSRFDMVKLENINSHYMRELSNEELAEKAIPYIEKKVQRKLSDAEIQLIIKAMSGVKSRAKTLIELADAVLFYIAAKPIILNEKAQEIVSADDAKKVLQDIINIFENTEPFDASEIEAAIKSYAEESNLKLGNVMQPIRAAVTGSTQSPSMFEVMEILGKSETISRINAIL